MPMKQIPARRASYCMARSRPPLSVVMKTRNETYNVPLHRQAPPVNVEQRAGRLLSRHGHLDGAALIRAVIDDPDAGRVALVSSFGTEAAVLLHMIARIAPHTPVLFIDTGKLFAQTLEHAARLTHRLGLADVRRIGPDVRDVGQADARGDLWARDSLACCTLRKVVPLERALEPFDLWISGRKRYQSQTRALMPVIETQGGRVKINPLADWSMDDIATYLHVNELPEHPLAEQGYLSVGCRPCTTPVASGEEARAGRWRGSPRKECGIHLERHTRVSQGVTTG
jgi:phosphoadenosine phosphosulfate reductase